MDTTELQSFGARYAAAWCSQNPMSDAEFFSEVGSLKVNDAAPATGRAAIADVARGFMTAFPDMIVSMDAIEPRSEGAVFRWTFTGANTGPNGTGQRVRFSGYEQWTFGPDGLVAQSLGHVDADEYARQLQHGVEA